MRTSHGTSPALQTSPEFPPTRYQGSKRRLLSWLHGHFERLDFDTALDAFCGTACVGYMLKTMGKAVTCNDLLGFSYQSAVALVENDTDRLSEEAIQALLDQAQKSSTAREAIQPLSPDFITRTFSGIYFTDVENQWLDAMCAAIRQLPFPPVRALAWHALGQAAIAKRPYNLFHRKNLYMRTADVPRTFGNKATWDKPFAQHFREHAEAANRAIFQGAQRCRATRGDVSATPTNFDLVYLDPPYVSARGAGVDYHHFYHFLEGMLEYDDWPDRIDWNSKHRRLTSAPSPWTSPRTIDMAFTNCFARFEDSTIAVSYRSDGCPSLANLAGMLRRFKPTVEIHVHEPRPYALSVNRRSREVLLIGR